MSPALLGCYTYAPVADVGAVASPAGVRVTVGSAEAARIEGLLPSYDGQAADGRLDGRLIEVAPDALLLTVSTTDQSGRQRLDLGQRLWIPRAEIVRLEVRSLDRWRTVTAVGAAVVAFAALALGQFTSTFGGTPGGGPAPERP